MARILAKVDRRCGCDVFAVAFLDRQGREPGHAAAGVLLMARCRGQPGGADLTEGKGAAMK